MAMTKRLSEEDAARLRERAAHDGNKRAGFACAAVFLHLNGSPLTLTQDDAYDLVLHVADGTLSNLRSIAERLAAD
jgi:death on curing protein